MMSTLRKWSTVGAILFAVSLSTNGEAQFEVDISFADPVDLPGFTTVTFTIDSEQPIFAIQGDFNGPMNQVNPEGTLTIFNDFNQFFSFVGADPSQDSQFLVSSSENFGAQMLVVGASLFESETQLGAAFTLAGDTTFGSFLPIAQVVIPTDSPGLEWSIKTVDLDENNNFQQHERTGVVVVPEPASAILIGAGSAALLMNRKRR